MFGAEDLAGDMGATRTDAGWEGFYAKSAVVTAAAAYGLDAIDTPHINIKNTTNLAIAAQKSLEMGYSGKLAIHPNQIEFSRSLSGRLRLNATPSYRSQSRLDPPG